LGQKWKKKEGKEDKLTKVFRISLFFLLFTFLLIFNFFPYVDYIFSSRSLSFAYTLLNFSSFIILLLMGTLILGYFIKKIKILFLRIYFSIFYVMFIFVCIIILIIEMI
jgi:hypothetical protein